MLYRVTFPCPYRTEPTLYRVTFPCPYGIKLTLYRVTFPCPYRTEPKLYRVTFPCPYRTELTLYRVTFPCPHRTEPTLYRVTFPETSSPDLREYDVRRLDEEGFERKVWLLSSGMRARFSGSREMYLVQCTLKICWCSCAKGVVLVRFKCLRESGCG